MNEFVSAIILAIIQGFSEWLPVSSSGHLVLFQHLLNYPGSLQFDVALHFGTLLAVFVYFGREITDIAEAVIKLKFNSKEGKLGLLILVSSIPAAIIGYTFQSLFEQAFQSLLIVAIGFAITGLFMFISSIDYNGRSTKNISYSDSIIIGLSQAAAIIPGISRSGATIGTALLRGVDREQAMKFSFLMSIPVIFGANLLVLGNNTLSPSLIVPTLVSFVVGLLSIHLLLKIIIKSRKNLRWFGLYALILSVLTFTYIFAR